jgi:hypothetical protein
LFGHHEHLTLLLLIYFSVQSERVLANKYVM